MRFVLGDRTGNPWVSVHPRAFGTMPIRCVIFDSTGTPRASVRGANAPERVAGNRRVILKDQDIDGSWLTSIAREHDDDREYVLVFRIIRYPAPRR